MSDIDGAGGYAADDAFAGEAARDVSDPELVSFAAELLEKRGGLVEEHSDGLVALLPGDLAGVLGLPEEARLGGETMPLLYGSPVLDRLIGLATAEIPVAYGHIEVPYLKKAGFEQLIGQDLVFTDGQVRVGSRAEARTTYMMLVFHYLALSDERKEGLVHVAVNEVTGAVIPELEERWREHPVQFFEPGKVPPHFPVRLEQAVANAGRRAREATEEELSDFFGSMRRRLHRDVKHTREYYNALGTEMRESLSHPNLTEAQRQERMAKIGELPREMERKIYDLEQKYRVTVAVKACAAVRLLVNVAQIMLEFNYRKLHRTVRVIWNPLTRRLDPLVCERCSTATTRVQPVIRGSAVELLCYECGRKRG